MKNAKDMIEAIAQQYDANGKAEHPIKVKSTRSYIRKFFKAEKRGGALKCGSHEIVLLPRPQEDATHGHELVSV